MVAILQRLNAESEQIRVRFKEDLWPFGISSFSKQQKGV